MPQRSVLNTPPWEFLCLGILLAAYLTGTSLFGVETVDFLNIAGPPCLALVMGFGCVRMVRLDGNSVWTALFWFRVSTAVYFGVGSLVPLLANEGARAYIQGFFRFYADDVAKVNLIVVVGVITVLAAANTLLALSRYLGHDRGSAIVRSKSDGTSMLTLGLFFLIAGGMIKYFFMLPVQFGLSELVVPQAVGIVGNFTYAAVFFLTAWSREHAKGYFPVVAMFVAFEFSIGILLFNKTEVLMVMMLFLFGLIQGKATVARLGMIAALLVLCYVAIIPVVTLGRIEMWGRYGGLGTAGFEERLEIVLRALGNNTAVSTNTDDVALVRLSYVAPAVYAVHLYDSGSEFKSLSNVLAVFIPRLFWPDKPSISQVAMDFSFAATGNPNNSVSPGLFAETYWNFGWPGVVLLMIPLGVILTFLSRYTLDVLHREQWIYFPVVLLAMRIGFRTDGYYIADVVGGTVVLVMFHMMLRVVESAVLPMLRRPVANRV